MADPALVAHLFRHQAGRLVAILTRVLGPRHLDLAEDVVQDALVAALLTWPVKGVPDNPAAWLLQVARRKAVDALRRDRAWATRVEPALLRHLDEAAQQEAVGLDDALALMFVTCHPSLSADSRIALTLKVAGGFAVEEIARGLFADPRAVAQRLVRAKRQIRDHALEMTLPPDAELPARLESVLEALALMFTAGYGARDGEALIREDLCVEAIRLARLLTRHPRTGTPDAHALTALLLLQGARLPARLDEAGDLAVLAVQDRSRWLTPLISEGLQHLDRAASGSRRGIWHLQAGIAALHATATPGATPWDRILPLYDALVALRPTGVVRLNRAIALGALRGPADGLAALSTLDDDARLADYHLLHAARGHFLAALDRREEAEAAWRRALACPTSEPERRFLQKQIR